MDKNRARACATKGCDGNAYRPKTICADCEDRCWAKIEWLKTEQKKGENEPKY